MLRAGGFTLVEMVIVVTIMMILVTLAVSTMGGMMETLRMKESVSAIRNSMEHARQLAIASDRNVVFRIYRLSDDMGAHAWRGFEYGVEEWVTDPNDPEYVDPSSPGFRTTFVSAAPMERLSGGLVFHPAAVFSVLIDSAQAGLEKGEDKGTDGAPRSYTSFKFTPEGRCNLPGTNAWTLTIVPEKSAAESTLPPDYTALQLDPSTARARVYRR
ncbi:MAG TPA: Verru_Chthon cassette protein D [Candidatus Saccharimonadia bacterium]|nr:Verru_Chthon cassette protein D [Candidatus Saccharimonadia bacterium]